MMNNHESRNTLKVDAVSAPIEDIQRTNFLVIYNINIPYQYLDERETTTRNILGRIKHLLMRDFVQHNPVYQITASYNLINTVTGEFRVWTGSFSVRDNTPAQITRFMNFDPDTFVGDSLEHLEDFEEKLVRAPELSSNWMLNSINSVIFNVQCVVDGESPSLSQFPRNGRRTHRTFALPPSN
jgi:hypothetical protein